VSALRRHPVLSLLLAGFAAVALVLVVTGVAVWRAAHEDGASRIDHADVILVLGAAEYGGRPSPVFAGRLKHAALLFRQGRADTVMVLGGGQPGDVTTEAEAGRDFLVEAGLPPAAVVADAKGATTFESLRSAAHLMQGRGMSSAFLVSDPWHNLRIVRMASDLGLDAHASATWQSAARSERTRVPGYLRETLAYLYYRLFGS
jgi:vancomycin permeability regulator SanA